MFFIIESVKSNNLIFKGVLINFYLKLNLELFMSSSLTIKMLESEC